MRKLSADCVVKEVVVVTVATVAAGVSVPVAVDALNVPAAPGTVPGETGAHSVPPLHFQSTQKGCRQ